MLGKKIKEMMKLRGITLSELSNISGLNKGGLSMIINENKNSITTDTLKKIAEALNIHPSYFLEDDVIGPDEILKHITDAKDRNFILSHKGAMWIKLTREAAESGLSPEKIRKVINLLQDR